jgi:hypothetical protein
MGDAGRFKMESGAYPVACARACVGPGEGGREGGRDGREKERDRPHAHQLHPPRPGTVQANPACCVSENGRLTLLQISMAELPPI